MEIKIYFAVKVLCAVFILYRLWIFIFSQQVYDAWEKVYRMMRIARIKLWKYRKEYRIYKEKKAEKAREKARRKKNVSETKVVREKPVTVERTSQVDDNDVIGKTRIVYLEDPDVARKKPTHSEPLVKEPIEEDEEINPEDVVQENKGLTKEEKEELMAPVGAEPDPDFNTAMTLSGTEILNLLENEIGCQHKIGHLLNEYLDEAGKPLLRRRGTPKKKEVFDIGKFV